MKQNNLVCGSGSSIIHAQAPKKFVNFKKSKAKSLKHLSVCTSAKGRNPKDTVAKGQVRKPAQFTIYSRKQSLFIERKKCMFNARNIISNK